MTELNEMQQKFIETESEKLIELTKQKNEFLKLSSLTAEQFNSLKSLLKQIETSQGKIAFASQPVENTPERVAAIDKFIKNIEVEVDIPKAEEGHTITSKDVFVSNIDSYIQKLEEHSEVLKTQLECESAILELFEEYMVELDSSDMIYDAFKQRVESTRKLKDDLTVAAECNAERLNVATDMRDKLINNYEFISDINFFMNNPLNMPDYDERVKAVSSIL